MPWDCPLGSPHALGVEATPKEEPPSGLGVGRVWSCLVRSTSLCLRVFRRLIVPKSKSVSQ
jgi:hypothetical protein